MAPNPTVSLLGTLGKSLSLPLSLDYFICKTAPRLGLNGNLLSHAGKHPLQDSTSDQRSWHLHFTALGAETSGRTGNQFQATHTLMITYLWRLVSQMSWFTFMTVTFLFKRMKKWIDRISHTKKRCFKWETVVAKEQHSPQVARAWETQA